MNIINIILGKWGFQIVKENNFKWNCWPTQRTEYVVEFEIDKYFHEKYDIAQNKTQMSQSDNPLRRQRHYTLVQLLKNSLQLNGDIVECGTWHGLSAFQIAEIVKESGVSKEFHVFDSFEGLSKIEIQDDVDRDELDNERVRKEFAYGLDLVKNNLKEFKFISYYKGWIPDRFDNVSNSKFCFVHIDVDIYNPIRDSIEFFYPRLVSGGIMIFDDYGYSAQFPGAKKAVDEFINTIKPRYFFALPSGQAIVIK